MGPSFREGEFVATSPDRIVKGGIGILFDSEGYSVYIGFAGFALSVDDVNQYWSLVRLVLVDDSYQYWSAV